MTEQYILEDFRNDPPIDFTIPNERSEFEKALENLDAEIKAGALSAVPVYADQPLDSEGQIDSLDPADPEVSLGKVALVSEKEIERVLQELQKHQSHWARTDFKERISIINKAADLMCERKRRLAAIVVRESGKPWAEADADIGEAIDFCRYYALQMEELASSRLTTRVTGELNSYFYKARGTAVIISPWNFPFAIPCGMLVAALVTGNVAVLKPAEQTSLIASQLVDILFEAGLPREVLAFLPGIGETVGKALVESPLVDLICFTGSKAVGLEIVKQAGITRPGQKNVKKVISEMGGKNCIIVDEDADLDEAIQGVLYSAYGFAGQKCSACSRVIAVGDAYETFIDRFCEAVGDIISGPPAKPASFLGPVIDEDTHQRILQTIETAKKECTLAYQSKVPSTGYFVPATIFRDVPVEAGIWQDEIFGPVLACRQEPDFASALDVANASPYALTGGLYSRSPQNIQTAYNEFEVGNLYINRGCTGAIVCRQPFGGFRMSGVGSKAGGPDYLLQFLEPRTVTENTMRSGFTPELA